MDGTRTSIGSQRENGFTLIELIVTLVVLGILAVVILPRFAGRADFDARGFFDATASILRYAQKSAVAQRRTVCVGFGADSSVSLTIDANGSGVCNTGLAGPDGTAPYTLPAPGGSVGFTAVPAGFSFLPSGAATTGQTISVAGLPGKTLTVWATTGYVQEN